MNSTDADQLAATRATADYQAFLRECLQHEVTRVREAQAALNDAEDQRRVQAAIAVAGGYGKTATASTLGISRPTLDAWLAEVARDAELTARVAQHEHFVVRTERRKQH